MCVSKVCKVNFEPNLEQDARKQVPHSYVIILIMMSWISLERQQYQQQTQTNKQQKKHQAQTGYQFGMA